MVSRGPYTMRYVPVTPSPIIVQKNLEGGLMEKLEQYSPQFAKLVKKAQLEGLMNESSNLTVLAPCNEYDLSDELITVLDIGQCKRLVNASLLPQIIKKADLARMTYWEVPSRERFVNIVVRVNTDQDVYVNDSQIVEADICAVNGLIHLTTGLVGATNC